jgi:hypothetical protein
VTYENLILGIAVYLLFWEHLPHWGTWFNRTLATLPGPLQTLYEQWRCPYCVGFWIGLAVHAITGNGLFAVFDDLPSGWGPLATPMGWFLDALCFAVLNKFGVLAITAISYPAFLGMEKKKEFMESMAAK